MQNLVNFLGNRLVGRIVVLGEISGVALLDALQAILKEFPVFRLGRLQLLQHDLDAFLEQLLEGCPQIGLVLALVVTAIGYDVINEEQRQRLDLVRLVAEVVALYLEMSLQSQLHHLPLVAFHVNVDAHLLASALVRLVGKDHHVRSDRLHGDSAERLVHSRKRIANAQGEALLRLARFNVLHPYGLLGLNLDDLDFRVLLMLRLEVLLHHALDQPLIEGLAGIQVIEEMPIVFYGMLRLAKSLRPQGKSRAKADDALRIQFLLDGLVRLLVARKAMRLVDDHERTRRLDCVERTVKALDTRIIVVTLQQRILASSQKLHVDQKHIDAVINLTRTLDKILNRRREVLTPLLLVLRRLQHLALNLGPISTLVLEVLLDIAIRQELRRSRLDRQGRHRDHELVDLELLMEFVDEMSIDVGLTRPRLHLDIQRKIARARLDSAKRIIYLVFVLNATKIFSDCRASEYQLWIGVELRRRQKCHARKDAAHRVHRLLLMRQCLLKYNFHLPLALSNACREGRACSCRSRQSSGDCSSAPPTASTRSCSRTRPHCPD